MIQPQVGLSYIFQTIPTMEYSKNFYMINWKMDVFQENIKSAKGLTRNLGEQARNKKYISRISKKVKK